MSRRRALTACVLVPLVSSLTPSVCFGQTWSTLAVDLAIPMNTGTPGEALTTTIANAGTVSKSCVIGTSCFFSSLPAGAFDVGAYTGCSNLGAVSLNNGGPTYAAGSMTYNSYAHLDSANDVIGNFVFDSIASRNVTVSMCLKLGFPAQNNGDDWDMLMIQDVSGLYSDMQLNSTACSGSNGFGVRIENHPVQHSPCIPLTPQSTYFFSLNWNMEAGLTTLYAFTEEGAPIGNVSLTDTGGSLNNVRIFSNENGTNNGTYSYYQNILMDWTTGANPLFWSSGPSSPDGGSPPNDGGNEGGERGGGDAQPPTNLTAAVQ